MYQHMDAALVRAAAHNGTSDLPTWPDMTGNTDRHVQQWYRWITDVWADPCFAEALEVASPDLAAGVRQVSDVGHPDARQTRRIVLSLTRYLLRATGRATPFGLFAGIAPVRFGPDASVRWGQEHRAVVRADAVWLSDVVSRFEALPEILHRLPVQANNLCFRRGGRLVVPWQQHTDDQGAETAPAEVTLRWTDAVETVVQAAQSPVRGADLTGKLAAEFPDTPEPVIDAMLAQLVAQRVLLTSLRPPSTATDPLGHVLAALDTAGAEAVTEARDTVNQLGAIHQSIARHNTVGTSGARRQARTYAARAMTDLCTSAAQPLMTDLAVDCEIVLPRRVAQQAESAARILARLSPYPSGSTIWRDYHARFIDRYGPGAVIPVADLVNPDSGLGFPATYRGALLNKPAASLTDRDKKLLALAQRATMDGAVEVVLDDRAVADLSGQAHDPAQVPPHVELTFHLNASSPAALERGDFTLAVVGATRAAGTTAGRFLHLLEPADRDRITQAYSDLPTLAPDAVPAQVSCLPLYVRTENVGRAPALLAHTIPLAEHHTPQPGTIAFSDLAVSGDIRRLWLVDRSTGRQVEPTALNAVDFRHHTQPITRFLCEISKSGTATFNAFHWGVAEHLPFVPRLRHGRTVLSFARWTLNATDVPDQHAPWPRWEAGIRKQRARLRLPQVVHLVVNGLRLRLDLDESAHLALLRAELGRAGTATLTEAPTPADHAWLDGRAHEIVVPLIRPATRPAAGIRPRPVRTTVSRDLAQLPGHGRWLYAKLYGHPAREPEILTRHLPDLLGSFDAPPPWWFLRYADPDPHIRLRLDLEDPARFATAAQSVGNWAAQLQREGLIKNLQFDSYLPETGRFGTGPALEAAHALFAADSAAALAQLHHAPGGSPALTGASFLDLATGLLGDVPTAMDWLTISITAKGTEPVPRALHAETAALADARTGRSALETAGAADVLRAWDLRRHALAAYRERLDEAQGITPRDVLPSLLHLHHLRVHGLDPDGERTGHRLARAAALSWTSRNGRTS